MTSIAFASAVVAGTNAWHMSSWGISAGDIIAIAGAGRGIVTWLTTDSQDNALLEFLKVAEKELCLRKGILDTPALNERWSQTVTLLYNGKRKDHHLDGLAQNKLENICKFSWMMTLIVAALDVSCSSTTLQKIIIDFSARLFVDAIIAVEYLQHEIPQHINGWRSSATVRNIRTAAQKSWNKLQNRPGHHVPGFIPDHDAEEVVRFLLWLTKGQEQSMSTASSDVHSLATVLSRLGFDTLHTGVKDEDSQLELPEGHMILVYSQEWVSEDLRSARQAFEGRSGMRIPLDEQTNMNEVVSLWPEPKVAHNILRLIFNKGMAAASFLDVQACPSSFGNRDLDLCLRFTSSTNEPSRRIRAEVSGLIDGLLIIASAEASHALDDLVAQWPDIAAAHVLEYLGERGVVPRSVARSREMPSREILYLDQDPVTAGMDSPWLQQLRVFLLGYYYGALRGIVDVSSLRIKEGFGSWSWKDTNFFKMISEFARSQIASEKHEGLYWRYQVMKMVAYLFAGAENGQLTSLKHGAAGVLAKLSVITPGLLGNADTPSKIKMFHLIDTDHTFFPSSQRGIITPADQNQCPSRDEHTNVALNENEQFLTLTSDPDFTAHIEPAWDTDTTLCRVAYRYHGRLVAKVNPLEAEAAILSWWVGDESRQGLPKTHVKYEDITGQAYSRLIGSSVGDQSLSRMIYTAQLSDFQGGLITMTLANPAEEPLEVDLPNRLVLLATAAKPRARTCIAAMYCHRYFDKRTLMLGYDWSKVSATPVVMQHSQSVLIVMP